MGKKGSVATTTEDSGTTKKVKEGRNCGVSEKGSGVFYSIHQLQSRWRLTGGRGRGLLIFRPIRLQFSRGTNLRCLHVPGVPVQTLSSLGEERVKSN